MAKSGTEAQRDYRKRYGFPAYPWEAVDIVRWFDQQLMARRLSPTAVEAIAEHLRRLSEAHAKLISSIPEDIR